MMTRIILQTDRLLLREFAGLKYLGDLDEVDIGYRLLPAQRGAGLTTEEAAGGPAWPLCKVRRWL